MDCSKIYSAIPAIMAEIGHIEKGKRNAQQGFMYRGVDDVMNALQPALVKHGVSIVPEVLEHSREERTTAKGSNLIYSICRVKFSFYADDGSSVSAIVVGEGMDSGDKATNKAMSVAFKYACFQTFCIPTEEMQDPDASTPEPSKKAEGKCIAPEDAGKVFQTMNDKGYSNRETDFFFFKTFGCQSLRQLAIEHAADAMKLAAKAKVKEAS